MAAKKSSKKQSKSDFIRQQPATLSAADVIAKGKEAGMTFTSSLVYMVRGRQDGKATPKKTATKTVNPKQTAPKKLSAAPKQKASAKKSTSTTPGRSASPKETGSKADFVRARAHLSPKEIVEDAKAAGQKLDVNYVYKVRGYDKTTAKRKSTARRPVGKKPAAKTATTKPAASDVRPSDAKVETLLRAVAAELGLGRAIEILQDERARVRVVIGG
jgi:hypothetical protein